MGGEGGGPRAPPRGRLLAFLEKLRETGDPYAAAREAGVDPRMVPLYLSALKSLGLVREPPSPSCQCHRCPLRPFCPLAGACGTGMRVRGAP